MVENKLNLSVRVNNNVTPLELVLGKMSREMTPCSFLFGASSHPYIPLHFEETNFPLVIISDGMRL